MEGNVSPTETIFVFFFSARVAAGIRVLSETRGFSQNV